MTQLARIFTLFILSTAIVSPGNAAAGQPPTPTVRLSILNPAGQPAAGVLVLLLPPSDVRHFIFTGDIHPQAFPDTQQFHAGSDGQLELPVPDEKRGMAVIDATGYADIDRQTLIHGGIVRLQPWARIEGQLMIGKRPGSGQTVMVALGSKRYGASNWQIISCIKTRADGDGRFAIDHVPPGEMSVSRSLIMSGRIEMGTQAQDVDLAPGQSATVTLGGNGRAILGKFDLPGPLVGNENLVIDCQISHFETPPRAPMPDDVLSGTAEQRRTWKTAFLKTDVGKQWESASQKAFNAAQTYPAEVASDGTFRIDDVAANTYNLEVEVSDPDGAVVAAGTLSFDVPLMPTGRSDDSLQLPPLALHRANPTKQIAVGDVAPDFNLPTLDGKTVHLSDFRGKFVLLDNWAIYCTPCIETMLKLREMPPQKDLIIIGLNRDNDPKKPLEFSRRQKIGWPQAWLGGQTSRATLETYLSDGSGLWLISPEGKLLAKDVDIPTLNATLNAAMTAKTK